MDTLEANILTQYSPQSYFKDALMFFKQQRFSDAFQCIDAAIVFSHNSPFYIFQKIRLLYEANAFKECSQFIISQLEYLYKNGSLYILCRTLDYLQNINHYDLDYFIKLLKYYNVPYCLAWSYCDFLTTKDKPFLTLARKAMAQDDFSLCLCYCGLYLKLHPTTADLCYMQAYCYHMLGNLLTAKKYYLEYADLCLDHSNTYMNIAFVCSQMGDYDTAIHYYQKASDIEPNNIYCLLYLGECYYTSRKLDAAIATYEKVLKVDPTNLQAYFNLVHIYKKSCKTRLTKRYIKLIRTQLNTNVSKRRNTL